MTQEGKLSRAMAKMLDTDLLPSRKDDRVEESSPDALGELAQREPDFQRVRGHCGPIVSQAMIIHDPHSEVAGQLRALRARIMATDNGKGMKVIALSSGTRSEGKTTIAVNLALALSEISGGRVVLVDGDMLRPNIAKLVNLRGRAGLVNVLENNLDLNGNIYDSGIPNLDILPTQAVAINKESESPLHQQCHALMKKLRTYYQFVVIDTPPVMIGSHAGVFAKHADGVILIARLEKTSRQVVKRAADELVKAGANLVGCVLTYQRHHVPDFIYRFFGTTSSHYYRYATKAARAKSNSKKRDANISDEDSSSE